jgi:hypothetical protein
MHAHAAQAAWRVRGSHRRLYEGLGSPRRYEGEDRASVAKALRG